MKSDQSEIESPITVVFNPQQSDQPYPYEVYGVSSSGTETRVASGIAAGVTNIPVSGYQNYRLGVSVGGVELPENIVVDSTVTVVFASQQNFHTILWSFFEYIGVRWQNAGQSGMPEGQFQQVISWQVGLKPEYGVFYAEAIAEYTRLLQNLGSPEAALDSLFTENQLPKPKLPNVQKYVLGEFMKWQIAFGGFRAFGPPYLNYSGWMGGGSFNASPPPYRSMQTKVKEMS